MEKDSKYISNFEVWWPNKSEKMAVNVSSGMDGYFYVSDLDLAGKIWTMLIDARKLEAQASLAATAGSAAPDLWLEYLRSEHSGEYDGLCKCVGYQNIRAGFEKWKWEREQVQPNRKWGIRMEGTAEQLEPILIEHIKDKKEYIFLEIGFAHGATHRAIRDIIKENITTEDWLTVGLDILGSLDVNFEYINKLFNKDELLIYILGEEEKVKDLFETKKYHSALVLYEKPREYLGKLEDNILDLCLIDAAHGYNDVTKDFLAIENKVKSGGLVIFHDFCLESQGTDKQWDGDFINVRKACSDLGLINNSRKGWTFIKELLGTRTTEHLEFGGNGMGIFKKL